MDFKAGWPYSAGRCHPLAILDDHSRYALSLAAYLNQRTAIVPDQAVVGEIAARIGQHLARVAKLHVAVGAAADGWIGHARRLRSDVSAIMAKRPEPGRHKKWLWHGTNRAECA